MTITPRRYPRPHLLACTAAALGVIAVACTTSDSGYGDVPELPLRRIEAYAASEEERLPIVDERAGTPAQASDSLELSVGQGYMGGDVTWASQGTIVHERRRATGAGEMSLTREVVRPTPEAWDQFWARMDSLGAWDWAANYSDPVRSSLMDGTGWRFTLRRGTRSLVSRGYNAMPPNFYEVSALVERLIRETPKTARDSGTPAGRRDR